MEHRHGAALNAIMSVPESSEGAPNRRKKQIVIHPLIMQAREHQFDKARIESFKNQIITQYTTSKDTQWLRSQFDYFVEGYKDRPKHENNIS